MILPAILDPFVEGAPAAVMTRIALDWIIDGTPLDRIFQEVADGQFEREFALRHFVDVMLDVACGFRPTPRRLREAGPRAGRFDLGLLPQARPDGVGRHRGGRPQHRRPGPATDPRRRRIPARADPGVSGPDHRR